jgi:hypothetical protein
MHVTFGILKSSQEVTIHLGLYWITSLNRALLYSQRYKQVFLISANFCGVFWKGQLKSLKV